MTVKQPWVHSADAHNYGSRHDAPITAIVIHTTEGSLAGTLAWFADLRSQVSAHYVIGKDGALVQCVDESYSAWHAGDGPTNHHSVGVELEAVAFDPHTLRPLAIAFPAAQILSLAQLIVAISDRYRIPIDRKHVIGHDEVPDRRHPGLLGGISHHKDPGPFFPWDELFSVIGAELQTKGST